jgi:hypothetical protein
VGQSCTESVVLWVRSISMQQKIMAAGGRDRGDRCEVAAAVIAVDLLQVNCRLVLQSVLKESPLIWLSLKAFGKKEYGSEELVI